MTVNHAQDASLRLDNLEVKRLAWAFALSAVLHLSLWGGYAVGKHFHLWEKLSRMAWVQKIAQTFAKPPRPVEMQPAIDREPPLVFVDVSPSQVTTEVPKDTPYYSDKNAKAANPDADKDSNIPKITGEQTQIVKTRDVPKNQFDKLMPTLPSERGSPVEEARAKPALAPGDLTLAKPEPTPKPDIGTAEKPRPRTVREAMLQRQPELVAQKMRQEGGVRAQQLDSSLDTKSTVTGAYDRAFIIAVQQRWYALLDQKAYDGYRQGRVMLQFILNYDGRITDMKVLENTTDSESLSLLCQKGVLDPAPFDKWPRDMRMMVGKDTREIKFTFYYN